MWKLVKESLTTKFRTSDGGDDRDYRQVAPPVFFSTRDDVLAYVLAKVHPQEWITPLSFFQEFDTKRLISSRFRDGSTYSRFALTDSADLEYLAALGKKNPRSPSPVLLEQWFPPEGSTYEKKKFHFLGVFASPDEAKAYSELKFSRTLTLKGFTVPAKWRFVGWRDGPPDERTRSFDSVYMNDGTWLRVVPIGDLEYLASISSPPAKTNPRRSGTR